jgi:hypothetical protein
LFCALSTSLDKTERNFNVYLRALSAETSFDDLESPKRINHSAARLTLNLNTLLSVLSLSL